MIELFSARDCTSSRSLVSSEVALPTGVASAANLVFSVREHEKARKIQIRTRTRQGSPSLEQKPRPPLLFLTAFSLILGALTPVGPILFPYQDAPRDVDAIMVLGPAEESRLRHATALLKAGVSVNLVVSTSDEDETFGTSSLPVCNGIDGYSVICGQSEPFTTQGEIAWIEELSIKNNWSSVLIVTSSPHVFRTRIYAERCYSGDALIRSDGLTVSPWNAASEYIYQVGATAKAYTVSNGCID